MEDSEIASSFDIVDSYPLTPMQQGFLFHSLYAPGSGIYVQQFDFVLHEDLETEFFWRAWSHILERHTILRSSFVTGPEGPIQRVHAHVQLPYQELDLRDLTPEEQNGRIETYLKEDRRRGFTFEIAPLIRLSLFRLADAEYRFIRTFHHLLTDGWTSIELFKEVFAYYEALRLGQEAQLAPAYPFRSYVDWLRTQDFAGAQIYWQNSLKGFREPTQVYADRNRDMESMYPGVSIPSNYAEQSIRIPERVTTNLEDFAKQNHVTLNTLIQAAWALLLGRYSGAQDIVFGATRACRRSLPRETGKVLGPLINTLPVRVNLAPEQKLSTWLQTLREQWVELRAYEHTSLTQIYEWSGFPSELPLFESIVNFNYQTFEKALHSQGGNWLKREIRLIQNLSHSLELHAFAESSLLLSISYDQDRFDKDTIKRMLAHLEVLLEGMRSNSERPIGSLPILTDQERKQILLRGERREYHVSGSLNQLFEVQAAATPDAMAVVFEGDHLTYQQLNARANRLAHYLCQIGVAGGDLVCLCLDRSLDMIVAILAILKAGGAYVPLELAYPGERLVYILDEVEPAVLITNKSLADRFEFSRTRMLILDKEQERFDRQPTDDLSNINTLQSTAYVIYTSGSTGKPKGVRVSHYNVTRLFEATQDWFHFDHNDVWTMFHSYAFDFSVWEMWGALLVGGKLVIVPYWTARNPKAFVELLEEQRVTILNLTPSVFMELLQFDAFVDERITPDLRWIIFGGEALNVPGLRPWFERRGEDHPRLVNMYGITETTVHVTYRPLEAIDTENNRSVIGQPIPDLQVYVLDASLQPVPIGVVGEIYVGGSGISQGYLNRPDLTEQRFIPNPFDRDGGLLYRSGDMARWLPNGDLEYLGRGDHQVKLRGFRIELGEIETLLLSHPAVSQAAALLRDDLEDKRLVAYLVAGQDVTPSTQELRMYLKERLPDYMIPSAFVFMEKFPFTPNGKLDRAALPEPTNERQTETDDLERPRSMLENQLCLIWEQVLGVQPVGIHDNFFDLGGHSLLAVQIVSRIRSAFQIEIPLRSLFETQTVAGLASKISITNVIEQEDADSMVSDSSEDREEGSL